MLTQESALAIIWDSNMKSHRIKHILGTFLDGNLKPDRMKHEVSSSLFQWRVTVHDY